MQTQRASLFESQESINKVLRCKLPSFSPKWAQRLQDNADKQEEEDDVPDLTFVDFLKYLEKANGARLHDLAIHRKSVSTAATPPVVSAPSKPWKFSKVAALDVETVSSGEESDVGEEDEEVVDVSMAPAAVAIGVSNTSKPRSKGKPKRAKPVVPALTNRGPPAAAQALTNSAGVTPSPPLTWPPCLCCKATGEDRHYLDKCREFLKMNPAEKEEFLRVTAICRNCLRKGHWASTCTSRFRCQICGRAHHTLFHQEAAPVGPAVPLPRS